MRARFEITEATAEEVTVECEALEITITIEADGVWTSGQEAAGQLERGGYDVAEWALRVATVGAAEAFSTQATSLTDSALATLDFFGWVVIQERATTVVVGDESGWWLTSYASLNGASLSRMERAEIGLGEARWNAHDSWCDAWNGEMFDGEE